MLFHLVLPREWSRARYPKSFVNGRILFISNEYKSIIYKLLFSNLLYAIHVFCLADNNGREVCIPVAIRCLYYKGDSVVLEGVPWSHHQQTGRHPWKNNAKRPKSTTQSFYVNRYYSLSFPSNSPFTPVILLIYDEFGAMQRGILQIFADDDFNTHFSMLLWQIFRVEWKGEPQIYIQSTFIEE